MSGAPFGVPCPAGTVKTEKTAGTPGLPGKVAPNLYRHRLNGTYCGGKKITGKRTIHALRTAHRTTANIALREWLAALGLTARAARQTAAPSSPPPSLFDREARFQFRQPRPRRVHQRPQPLQLRVHIKHQVPARDGHGSRV